MGLFTFSLTKEIYKEGNKKKKYRGIRLSLLSKFLGVSDCEGVSGQTGKGGHNSIGD